MSRSAIESPRRALEAYVVAIAVLGAYGLATVALSHTHRVHHGLEVVAFAVSYALLGIAPMIALLRQHRWAWFLSASLDSISIILNLVQGVRVVPFIIQVAALGLLLSPPIRQYVGVSHAEFR
jgi:hypothetical protein